MGKELTHKTQTPLGCKHVNKKSFFYVMYYCSLLLTCSFARKFLFTDNAFSISGKSRNACEHALLT